VYDGTLGVLVHVLTLDFQLLRQPDVIVIQEGDELTACAKDSLIPSRCRACLTSKVNDPAQISVAIQIFARRLCGTIVNDNNFQWRKRLRQHGENGLINVLLSVVIRDNHRYVAGHGRGSFRWNATILSDTYLD